ncbi:MAG: ABC transporter substrate-binding protein [Alphaproteobacteria bacterium]|nr:ABC transporter substrate-binding protein [Alphaproteobacteria bacterium]
MLFRAIVGTIAALMLCLGSAANADPLVIRHGWVSMTNVLSPLVFEHRDILRHYGKSYVVVPMHFAGTSPEIQAIAADDVDVITLAFSTLAAGVQNAHLDLRVVADGFQDGAPGYLSSPFLVRNDSGIRRIEDLKGKVLASNAIGGALDVALRALLRQHGLEDKRDYTLVEAAFPNMNAMLLEKKVDLIADVPPFIFAPQIATNAHPLARMKDAVGRSQMIVLAMRKRFISAHRAALTDFFEDMLRGERWLLDPANRAAARENVARATKLPVARLKYLYTSADYYHAPDGRPDIAAMQRDMATEVKFGFLKTALDVRKYVDLSLIDAAARRARKSP